MNNNNRNNNNNRRRGRGNNRQQGGGQQLNRVDSRARGNAPQMLEKFRKLAHDAHLNGDRVQEEYYLQFADHYFRVLADQRQRQEEVRAPRGERWQEGGETFREDGEDGGEYGAEGEYQPYDRQSYSREEREPRPPREERDARPPREDREPRAPREEREPRAPREARLAGEERIEAPDDDLASAEVVGDDAASPEAVFEPAENPFVRGSRGLRPRREQRPRRDDGDAPLGLDPASLPPAISAGRDADEAQAETPEAAAEEAPRRRTRRPRPSAGDADESLEVTP